MTIEVDADRANGADCETRGKLAARRPGSRSGKVRRSPEGGDINRTLIPRFQRPLSLEVILTWAIGPGSHIAGRWRCGVRSFGNVLPLYW